MKKLILFTLSLLLLISCSTVPLEISENDDNLRMIGGKEALLDDIVYPADALQMGVEDVVNVLAYIDTSGTVIDCKIIEGNDLLNDAAVSAMMKQRFHPYILDGQKRPIRVAIPIIFSILKDIDIRDYESEKIMNTAESYLNEPVVTLNEFVSSRSPGSPNDYYSEGITWWPNPEDPNAPYIIIEDNVNPDAFRKHAELLNRTGKLISGLTAAYLVSGNSKYASRAVEHVKSWFIDTGSGMNPNVKFAQAIHGRTEGRGVGINEALPLLEIIRSHKYIHSHLSEKENQAFDTWLLSYRDFLKNDEKYDNLLSRKDIYSLSYFVQLAAIAVHLENMEDVDDLRRVFRDNIQSFTENEPSAFWDYQVNRGEKYNIFLAADLMAIAAQLLSNDQYNAWESEEFSTRRAGDIINYLYSGILNEVLDPAGSYHGRYISLLLAGKAYENVRYLDMWHDLNSVKMEQDGYPIREPVLWTK